MDHARRPSFFIGWLFAIVQAVAFLALAWMLSNTAFSDWVLSSMPPVVPFAMLAAMVFLLPFRKHLPRPLLRDWMLSALGKVFAFVLAVFNFSLLLSMNAVGPIFLGVMFVAITVVSFWRWRMDVEAYKEAQNEMLGGAY